MSKGDMFHFVEGLQSEGRHTFTLADVRKALVRSDSAAKAALFRIARKGLVVALRRGFYVIVPPEYRVRGISPSVLFVDDLMRYLGRSYYAGLLSAAALHGAGHQQPQEFHVVSGIPSLRSITSRGARIRFFARRSMPVKGIEEKKTDTGIIKLSSPELTAIDLVVFEKRIGGINRVAEVLVELADRMRPGKLGELAATACPVSAVQRLGYLLETSIGAAQLADVLFKVLQIRPFFPVSLCSGGDAPAQSTKNRWKVRVNVSVDIDI